jgi:hypothetical protein
VYNRLFTKILDSSIWLEADATRIVWITLLAAMDEDGYAAFSCNENLSRRANVPMEALSRALLILESPDQYNPDDEFDGRRIEKVQGGWMVLKAPYYRNLLSREIAREQNRVRVKRHRAKSKGNDANVTKHYSNAAEAYAEADADADAKQKKTKAHSQQEVERFCVSKGLPVSDGEWFWNKCEGCGWKNNGKAIKNWENTITAWRLAKYFPSQKEGNPIRKRPLEEAPKGEAYRNYDPNKWFKEEMEEHEKRKKQT